MSVYHPDKWVVLKVTHPEHGVLYKVLGSWYGGYGGSNSWKLSSGISGVPKDLGNGSIEVPQYSGSTYMLYKNSHGMSGYTAGVYQYWLEELEKNPNSATIELLDEDFDLASIVVS